MSGTLTVGDHFTAYTPSKSEMIEGFLVRSVKPYAQEPQWTEVELDREFPIPEVNNTGNDFPGGVEMLKFTGMYNVDACGGNYVIRNCTFRE